MEEGRFDSEVGGPPREDDAEVAFRHLPRKMEVSMENLSFDGNSRQWKEVFQEALVEVNPEKLKEKIAESEAAIFQRLQVLQSGPGNVQELRALQDASNALLVLKREVLKFPDW